MGFLNFFKKREAEPEINYEELIEKAWDIFKKGFMNPNSEARRLAEEAVYNLDSPEGKRFFSAAMQEPDLRNRVHALQKLYERGGWRLAENFLNIACDTENELEMPEREEIIYFIGNFSDPDAYEFLKPGIIHPELKIRIATISAIAGVKNSQALKPVKSHLENVTEQLEKFVCGLAMYQFNDIEGKKIIDEIFSENLSGEYAGKFQYLDLNKAMPYLEKIADKGNKEAKEAVISMIKDNRGINLLKKLIKDADNEVSAKAIAQAAESGLSSTITEVKEVASKSQSQEKVKDSLAILGDRKEQAEIEDKARETSLNDENLEKLTILSSINEQHISEIIDKLLLPVENIDDLSDEEVKKISQVVKILIRYGKMASVPLLSRYCEPKYLENQDLLRWEVSCNSSAAVLCIIERNRTFIKNRDVKE